MGTFPLLLCFEGEGTVPECTLVKLYRSPHQVWRGGNAFIQLGWRRELIGDHRTDLMCYPCYAPLYRNALRLFDFVLST